MITRSGGCHCGRVRFEITTPAKLRVADCNCSICEKSGFLHLIVPKSRFNLVSGSESLTDYQFNTGTAHHLFCSVCGVKSFYIPRSHPQGYSVNVRCLDGVKIADLTIDPFDGRDWDAQFKDGRSKTLGD